MHQVLVFFSKAIPLLAMMFAMGSHFAFSQQDSGLSGETELFRQAIEKFRGASRITMADDDDFSLRRWESPNVKVEIGVVLEWNAEKLFLVRPNDGKERSFASSRVLSIEPVWDNPLATQLHELYSKQRWADAIALGPRILGGKSEYPSMLRWQQKMLLAELVECRCAMGNWEKGAVLFHSLALATESIPPLFAAAVPIPWSDATLIADRKKLHALSVDWLREQNEHVKLMAASWLLDSEQQQDAKETLELLAKQSKNVLVAKYAEAQLWRLSPPQDLATKRVSRCYSIRDSLLLPLQAGPTTLLAERFYQANERELALGEYLRVATMHSEHYRLASHAAKQASTLLREGSRLTEAEMLEKLYRK